MSDEHYWHSTWFDPVLNMFVAQQGSLTYVLEHSGGRPLSSGHHRLFFINGELFGQLGSQSHPVTISPQVYRLPQTIREDTLEDRRLLDFYKAHS